MQVSAFASRDEPGKFVISLVMKNVSESDGGQYYCHAENSAGEARAVMGVHVSSVVSYGHVSQCCQMRQVSSECLDLCSDHVTYSSLVSKPQCLRHYSSILQCGNRDQDHSRCCSAAGVSSTCVSFCRPGAGVTVPASFSAAEMCAVVFARKITHCFSTHEDIKQTMFVDVSENMTDTPDTVTERSPRVGSGDNADDADETMKTHSLIGVSIVGVLIGIGNNISNISCLSVIEILSQ